MMGPLQNGIGRGGRFRYGQLHVDPQAYDRHAYYQTESQVQLPTYAQVPHYAQYGYNFQPEGYISQHSPPMGFSGVGSLPPGMPTDYYTQDMYAQQYSYPGPENAVPASIEYPRSSYKQQHRTSQSHWQNRQPEPERLPQSFSVSGPKNYDPHSDTNSKTEGVKLISLPEEEYVGILQELATLRQQCAEYSSQVAALASNMSTSPPLDGFHNKLNIPKRGRRPTFPGTNAPVLSSFGGSVKKSWDGQIDQLTSVSSAGSATIPSQYHSKQTHPAAAQSDQFLNIPQDTRPSGRQSVSRQSSENSEPRAPSATPYTTNVGYKPEPGSTMEGTSCSYGPQDARSQISGDNNAPDTFDGSELARTRGKGRNKTPPSRQDSFHSASMPGQDNLAVPDGNFGQQKTRHRNKNKGIKHNGAYRGSSAHNSLSCAESPESTALVFNHPTTQRFQNYNGPMIDSSVGNFRFDPTASDFSSATDYQGHYQSPTNYTSNPNPGYTQHHTVGPYYDGSALQMPGPVENRLHAEPYHMHQPRCYHPNDEHRYEARPGNDYTMQSPGTEPMGWQLGEEVGFPKELNRDGDIASMKEHSRIREVTECGKIPTETDRSTTGHNWADDMNEEAAVIQNPVVAAPGAQIHWCIDSDDEFSENPIQPLNDCSSTCAEEHSSALENEQEECAVVSPVEDTEAISPCQDENVEEVDLCANVAVKDTEVHVEAHETSETNPVVDIQRTARAEEFFESREESTRGKESPGEQHDEVLPTDNASSIQSSEASQSSPHNVVPLIPEVVVEEEQSPIDSRGVPSGDLHEVVEITPENNEQLDLDKATVQERDHTILLTVNDKPESNKTVDTPQAAVKPFSWAKVASSAVGSASSSEFPLVHHEKLVTVSAPVPTVPVPTASIRPATLESVDSKTDRKSLLDSDVTVVAGGKRKFYVGNIPKTTTYDEFVSCIRGGLIDDIYVSGLSVGYAKPNVQAKQRQDQDNWFGYFTFFSEQGARNFVEYLRPTRHGVKNEQLVGYITLGGQKLPVYFRSQDQRELLPETERAVKVDKATRCLLLTFGKNIGTKVNKTKAYEGDTQVRKPASKRWTWDNWKKAFKEKPDEIIAHVRDAIQIWKNQPIYVQHIRILPVSESSAKRLPRTGMNIPYKTPESPTFQVVVACLRISTAEKIRAHLAGHPEYRDHCDVTYYVDECNSPIPNTPVPAKRGKEADTGDVASKADKEGVTNTANEDEQCKASNSSDGHGKGRKRVAVGVQNVPCTPAVGSSGVWDGKSYKNHVKGG